MKKRDLRNLLARAVAAIETPGDLTEAERRDLVEDLDTAMLSDDIAEMDDGHEATTSPRP